MDGQAAPTATDRRYVNLRNRLIVFGVLAVVVVAVLGKIHVVHGGGVGLTSCKKAEWGLGDTFVDLDDYIGKPVIQMIGKAQVIADLLKCGALDRGAPDYDRHAESRPSAQDVFQQRRDDVARELTKQLAAQGHPEITATADRYTLVLQMPTCDVDALTHFVAATRGLQDFSQAACANDRTLTAPTGN